MAESPLADRPRWLLLIAAILTSCGGPGEEPEPLSDKRFADVLYAVTELKTWLQEEGQLVAAVSFGVADEAPDARPRRSLEEIVKRL